MKNTKTSLKRLMAKQIASGILIVLLIMTFSIRDGHSASSSWKPTRTVEMIVGTAPGGGSDLLSRTMALLFKQKGLIEQNIIVVNKPGAGGKISWNYLNEHAGDGHYLEALSPTFYTSFITGKSPIHYTDVTPLAVLSADFCTFTVNADSPIKTGKDLLEQLKKDPKSLSIGISNSRGNHNHTAVAMAVKASGGNIKELKIVVFGSSSEPVMAVLGGHVDVAITPADRVAPHLESGKLRAIAIAAPQRSGASADIPTWKEQGFDVVMGNSRTLIGPKGLSEAQIAYWDDVLGKLTQLPEWKKYLKDTAQVDLYHNSKQSIKFIEDLFGQFKTILTELGMAK